MARNNGFQINWNTDPIYRKYSNESSVYAMNNIACNKFLNTNNEGSRTQKYIDFKAVIYEDVLYVWFKDVDGNNGLGWKIPLTDEQFGGYAAGSDYKLALYMAISDTKGSFTDLDVKMGYHVTEQAEFIQDQKGTTYSFMQAMEKIDAGMEKWEALMKTATAKDMFYDP